MMEDERERKALRDALYEGFEPPSPQLRETILASAGAAPAVPALFAWLQVHWPFVTASTTAALVAAGVAAAVVLNQPRPAPPPPPVVVYVGYADSAHAGSTGGNLPNPWSGGPDVNFEGMGPNFDAGAIRLENPSATAMIVDRVTVDIGAQHFDLWPTGLQVPAHGSLILTQTSGSNFDTSETNPTSCQPSTQTPVVHVTVGGKTQAYTDVNRVLTVGGIDQGNCGGSEGHPWERIRD